MKRSLAVLAALALLALPASARAQGFGIKGGLSYGNVSNRGVLPGELDGRTGFAAGLALGTEVGVVGLGLEGLYAQRGVTSSNNFDSRRLDYIDVPLYLRLMIPTPGVQPYAFAGPQVSFELRCKAGDADCPDNGRPKTTYAGIIGAGVRLGAESALSIEGRYMYGLTDLNLNTVTDSESYKTRAFLILMGISF